MIWFDKGIGAGPQSVNIRDGKLTERGRNILWLLGRKKSKSGRLSAGATRMLRTLEIPITRSGQE